ncbi:MAG: GNAT family N-acetyltransferase [Actinobacteria bacterium]|nr:GNAT family N-acetyltransferase [Actinomycetota bacterium]
MRPATGKDAGGWIALLRTVSEEGRFLALENVGGKSRALVRHLRYESWTQDSASIVAIEQEKVVGQTTMFRQKGAWSHIAELGMSVAASHRRIGVGSGLIDGAVDWAHDFDVEKIVLNVFPHNQAAIALYEKKGFIREGLRKRHAKLSYGYEDLIEMSLWVGG